jgi:hypothetical protein
VGLVEHPTNAISDKVIGAAIEVHRHLGPGLLESSYHACLCRELDFEHSRITATSPYPWNTKDNRSQLMTYLRLQRCPPDFC